MKHAWKGQQMGGDPADAGSTEWVAYCDNCGVEADEDNEDGECAPVEDDAQPVAPILPPYDDGWGGRRNIKSAIDRLREQGFTDVET